MRSRVQLSGEGGRASGEAGRGERTRREGGAFRGNLRDAALVLCAVLFVAGCGDGAQEENIEAVRLEVSPLEVDVAEGDAVTLTATLLDANGRRLGEGHAKYAFTWWVANDGIVRVEPQGRAATVRYLSPGSTIVRVTAVRSWDAPPPGMSPNVGGGKGLSGDSKVNSRQKPASLTASSGNKQKSRVKTVLPGELVVQVLDKHGKPIAGQQVTFRPMSVGGTMLPEQTLTDSLGYASARWELGPTAGPQQADVSVSGVQSVVFEAEAIPGEPASMHVVAGDGQTGSVSQALAADLIIIVRDAFGNPAPGAAVTWSVVSGGGTLRTIVSPTGTDGQSIARWTLGPNTGGQQASATAGPLAATFTATAVAPSTVASLTVTPDAVTLDGLGLSTQLTAVAKDASGNTLTGVTIQWTSSNTGTATVDGSGRVTAKAVGTALIIAAAAGVADTAHFTVRQVPTSIELSPASLALAVGESAELRATVKDAGSSLIPNATVSWRSSATSIATVSDAGLVKGVADGSASIAATSGSVSTSASAQVSSPPAPPSGGQGIWLSAAEIAALPTSGAAWNNLKSAADQACSTPDLANQDDPANVCVLAKGLVYARIGGTRYRDSVISALHSIVNSGTYNGRALALGRELIAYVIAADLIGLSQLDPSLDRAFRAKIVELRTTYTHSGPGNLVECHEGRPNNWGLHCGATLAAIAVYLGDNSALERVAVVFRGWTGDRAAYAGFKYGSDLSWHADPKLPVGINPKGSVKDGHNIDGVQPEEMRRCGSFQWPPCSTDYTWEALQGAVAMAWILHRQGYRAFDWSDQALLRAVVWLHTQADAPAVGDDTWQPHIINKVYGSSFPAPIPSRPGKNVGWADWTHAR
jgi:hypothetical protein